MCTRLSLRDHQNVSGGESGNEAILNLDKLPIVNTWSSYMSRGTAGTRPNVNST